MQVGHNGRVDLNLLIVILTLCIFLFFNMTNNTRINLFMGDAGSSGLGFIISTVLIDNISSSKSLMNLRLHFGYCWCQLWILLMLL